MSQKPISRKEGRGKFRLEPHFPSTMEGGKRTSKDEKANPKGSGSPCRRRRGPPCKKRVVRTSVTRTNVLRRGLNSKIYEGSGGDGTEKMARKTMRKQKKKILLSWGIGSQRKEKNLGLGGNLKKKDRLQNKKGNKKRTNRKTPQQKKRIKSRKVPSLDR